MFAQITALIHFTQIFLLENVPRVTQFAQCASEAKITSATSAEQATFFYKRIIYVLKIVQAVITRDWM